MDVQRQQNERTKKSTTITIVERMPSTAMPRKMCRWYVNWAPVGKRGQIQRVDTIAKHKRAPSDNVVTRRLNKLTKRAWKRKQEKVCFTRSTLCAKVLAIALISDSVLPSSARNVLSSELFRFSFCVACFRVIRHDRKRRTSMQCRT